ncbi:KptA family-domain-containing protein [Dunaliella salina]|uniref:2'-phosphotransferase n=1 Tax=Dunaliella salina TaxID=3046 RepID=A0ABQ7GUK5_DUNSA|nr:KptA family-domain-containing protein [Dunaliella salina]|eukprot:KAF5838297.1 KptA family-domain-containing protein [Dunaliella salina]
MQVIQNFTRMTKRKRGMETGASNNMDVQLSKAMSRMLRHAPPKGSLDNQGWMELPVLLRHLKQGATEEQVRRIVNENDKKRFVLDDSAAVPRIRAAQGHSIQLSDPILEPVTDATSIPLAVHVTSQDGWSAIQTSGELRPMSRTHIHFATQPNHMRANKWAQVYLKLKLQEAMDSGYKFFLSSNQVLLCEGTLPVRFIESVDVQSLPQDWARERRSRDNSQDRKDQNREEPRSSVCPPQTNG